MDRGFSEESAKDAIREPEEILTILHRSRKAYLIEYTCGIILLSLMIATSLRGMKFPSPITYFIFGLGLFSICFAEGSRALLSYIITTEKISIVRGIIKQTKKNINYHPLAFVPDISMKQNRIQRLLNYGTVSIESGSSTFEIREVDNPKIVMELVEKMIEKTRAKR